MLKTALYTSQSDSDASAWANAVGSAGVSGQRLHAVAKLIRGLKSDGLWSVIDRLWLFAAENSTQALTDLKARASATLSGTAPTFTANRGYAGNGASAFVNLGIAPSALPSAGTNSMHIAYYMNTVAAADIVTAGSIDAGGLTSYILAPYSDSKVYPRLGDGAAAGVATAGGAGFYVGDRISSSQAVGARNGVDAGTVTTTAAARSTATAYALADNNNGTAQTFAAAGTRMSMISLGGSLGASGRPALYIRTLAYLTAIGAN